MSSKQVTGKLSGKDIVDMTHDGPWTLEPDFGFWGRTRPRRYEKAIMRGRLGQLNGYLGLSRTHPWTIRGLKGKHFYEIDVHGGVTYNEPGLPLLLSSYLAEEGIQPESAYWVGFDTAHLGDHLPSCLSQFPTEITDTELWHTSYKHWDYVLQEVQRLELQARAAWRPWHL